MKWEVDPHQTGRGAAFDLWLNAPMPMVTLFKTLDVTRPVRFSRKHRCSFNMLLCWCVGKAASRTEDFYLLPVGDKLFRYDRLAVSTVVKTKGGGISTCDIPFSDSLRQFDRDYRRLTTQVHDTGSPHNLDEDSMVIGTSALIQHDIDGAVNLYAGVYNNPFLIWSRYRNGLFRTTLPVSFQFHHTQLDGVPAAQFLDEVQKEINQLSTQIKSSLHEGQIRKFLYIPTVLPICNVNQGLSANVRKCPSIAHPAKIAFRLTHGCILLRHRRHCSFAYANIARRLLQTSFFVFLLLGACCQLDSSPQTPIGALPQTPQGV